MKGHRLEVTGKAQLLTEGLCTMDMDQSALMKLLEMFEAAGVDERICVATRNPYQTLIDAEASETISAGRSGALKHARRCATVLVPVCS